MKRYTFTRHLARKPMRSAIHKAIARIQGAEECHLKPNPHDVALVERAISWHDVFDKWVERVLANKAQNARAA